MAADRLWLSGAYDTDAVGLHFTWKKLPTQVGELVPELEARLLPLEARPHWGQGLRGRCRPTPGRCIRASTDFRALARRHDPDGVFTNNFLARKLGL
ncbi:MAG: D-arabinono-1,4-lactone oxidase [Galbitalea sp.]